MIKGIKFPFQRDSTGFPAAAEDAEAVMGNIRGIIQAEPGARVMRPNFGLGARRIIWEATGPVLNAWIDYELRRAISVGEPRVVVESISAREQTVRGNDVVVVSVAFRMSGRRYVVQEEVAR